MVAQFTPLAVAWAITFSLGSCSGDFAQSPQAHITTDSTFPSPSNTLATVPVPLQTGPSNLSFPSRSSAVLTVPETILIAADVVGTALSRGLSTIHYQRVWTSSQGSFCGQQRASVLIQLVSGAAGPFAIIRMELHFPNPRSTIVVPRGTPGLKAQADIRYSGTGTLRGRWRVAEPGARNVRLVEQLAGRPLTSPAARFPLDDWRILAEIRRTVTFGDRVLIESPDAPSLPTFATGQHLVTLEILQGQAGDPLIGFQFPVARYFVEAGGGGPGVAAAPLTTLRLLSPEDRALLPLEPPVFEWAAVPGAALYRLEIYEADPRALFAAAPGALETGQRALARMDALGPRIFSALSQEGATRLALHPAYLGRFRPGQTYLWKVVALSPGGDTLAQSLARALTFRAP